ncbi:DUF488 family protein [Thermovenabulum gondwanense]|uniref:DUF488 domain-containing protein n=1 Tax=Thermovenabulum gondwanense TaxID=520767 RepID=A0A162MF19_9FIRM|nr:DUF488 domain-containing protein [Thermovenabulum gondwanense]KYO65525.1 hypothetical protein ATZ99_15610 [Thermovenabulum gondwanense]
MKIFTIGFTKKSAEEFFELLGENGVKLLLDIRLRNNSQLAGFAKGEDLRYFIEKILGIEYIHDIRFAPTDELMDSYKDKKISWDEFKKRFFDLMDERNIEEVLKKEYLNKIDGICLLCSEEKAKGCHRSLVAEYIKEKMGQEDIEIIHL